MAVQAPASPADKRAPGPITPLPGAIRPAAPAVSERVANEVRDYMRELISIHYPGFDALVNNIDIDVVEGLNTFAVTEVDGRPRLLIDANVWNRIMAEMDRAARAGESAAPFEKTLAYLFLHEILHIALRHIDRLLKYYNRNVANIAGDLVINEMLKDIGVLDNDVRRTFSQLVEELTGIKGVRLLEREVVEEMFAKRFGIIPNLEGETDVNIADAIESFIRRVKLMTPPGSERGKSGAGEGRQGGKPDTPIPRESQSIQEDSTRSEETPAQRGGQQKEQEGEKQESKREGERQEGEGQKRTAQRGERQKAQEGEKQEGERQKGEKQEGERQEGEEQEGEKQEGEGQKRTTQRGRQQKEQEGERQKGERQKGEQEGEQEGERQEGEKQEGERQKGEREEGEQEGEKQEGEGQEGEQEGEGQKRTTQRGERQGAQGEGEQEGEQQTPSHTPSHEVPIPGCSECSRPVPVPGAVGNQDLLPESEYKKMIERGVVKKKSSSRGIGLPPSIHDVVSAVKEYLERQMALWKSAGINPGKSTALLRKIKRAGEVNWRLLLRRALSPVLGRERIYYTYSRLDKRVPFFPGKVKYYDHGVRRVVVLVDTSGSISENELRKFVGEVMGLAGQFDVNELHVITWDTEVTGARKYTSNELRRPVIEKLEVRGRGGTFIDPALKYVLDKFKDMKLDAVIVFTDGLINFSRETRELASAVAKKAKVAIYVYTALENPEMFEKWTRVKVLKGIPGGM